MSTEKTINSTIRTNLLSNEDFVYAHLVKFERPFTKNADGNFPTDDSRYAYYTDGSHDIVFGGNTYYANRILSVGNYSESTQARASAMSLTLAGEDLKPAISLAGSISTSGVFTPTTTTYEGYPLDFVERGYKEGDEISFTYSSTTLTYRISSFTSNNTVLNLAVIGTSPDIVSSFPGSTLSQTFTLKVESDELTAPLQDRGITVDGTSAASPNFINRSVLIDKVFIDPETGTIWGNDSIRVFKGVIQNVAIDEKATGVQVKWGLTSHWGNWNEVGGRVTTDEIHRSIGPDGTPNKAQPIRNEYASDLGFLHAESSLSAIANYTTQMTKTKLRSKRRGLGFRKKYWQEEYQVDVENEVDLNIHLQGKYLPIVYGVQRINGNPIFADTLNYNSQVVYTADAICEGEIHGLYNIYIDDIPLICVDDNDYDVRGPGGSDRDNTQLQCYGRMSYGDTIGGLQGEPGEQSPDAQASVNLTTQDKSEISINHSGTYQSFHQSMINNDHRLRSGIRTTTTGLLHRESWSINHPHPVDQSFFQGRPNQLASSMLYGPATVTDGIEGIRVTHKGYGYTSNPTVTISAPSGGGTTAEATASRTNDDDGNLTKIGSIRVTNPGSGYTDTDIVTVTFSGGGGNGARATADRGGYKRQTDYYNGTEPYWSSNHRLLDTAYTANRFEIDAESTELPEIEYVVKGKLIDCYNYTNTYVPDAVLGGSDDNTDFAQGDLVTIQYSTDGSSWTTDTSGSFASNKFKIMDKFQFETNRGILEWRFRLDKAPALAVTNGAPARTWVRMVDDSNNYWHMITWNHTLCTNKTFPNEFKDPTWSVNSTTGDLTATFSGSDATALGNSVDTNSYQFYSDDWAVLPDLENAVLVGTWSGNALTFKANLKGLSSTALTNFNDHVTVRLGRQFDLSGTSEVANITNTLELVNSYTKADFGGTNRTYVGRGAILKNDTTGEEREIEDFNTTTDVVTIVTPFYTPPTSSHKFTITGRGADRKASINPAMQTLDYLRNNRYGKGLEDDDIDIDSFITSARLCDARSDIEISLESSSSIAINDIYELKAGGDSDSGNIVAQGKVIKITGNVITLTDVIGKFTKAYSTFGEYQEGDIIYTTEGRYYRAATTVTNTSTTEPTHGGTASGMTFIGLYSDGASDNADLTLHKASGSGPATIKMSKTQGNPVEYALYDSDFAKYWRYYGWDRNSQAEVTRHQTNFILDTGKSKFENINALLSHFNGILSYENGKYVLDVETQESAPTASLNASQENINPYYIENSDIIGKISLKDDSQKKGKNTIKASVADPQNHWGSRSITFFNSDFLKADRDIVKTANFPFTGITNYWNGRIGVEKELFQSRFSKEINFTIGPKGLLLKVGQVISMNYDSFGWSNKLFRINNLNFNANCTVSVKATEYDDSIYEITKQQALNINQQSSANFSINSMAAPTLAAPSLDKSGSVILTWTNSSDFDELYDSTEIYVSNDNDRTNATLLAIVDNAESFAHTTATQNTKYYWIRHRRITTINAKKQITHSSYHPTSRTGGLQGTSLSISAGAATIELIPSTHVIDYSKGGVENTSVTFTTQTFNMEGDIYYEFLVTESGNNVSKQNTTTSTWTLPDANEPAVNGTPIQVTVKARQTTNNGALLAQDIVTIHSVQDGQDTVTGILTNEAHTIPADASGNVSGGDLSNAGGTFKVYYGNALQNGNVADSKISFSVSGTPVGCSVAINENTGVYTVSGVSANSGTATFSCTLEGSLVGGVDNTDDVTVTKVYTIAKAGTGATGNTGAAGSTAKVVVVSPSSHIMTKIFEPEWAGGALYVPQAITISAKCANTTADGVWSTTAGTLSSIVNTHGNPSCVVTSGNMVDGMTVTYTAHADDGSISDSTTLELLPDRGNAITPILSNEAHILPASSTGVVSSYSGSGTTIQVYEGSHFLDYDGVGTADGHWKVVIGDTANITEGTASSTGSGSSRYATIGAHSAAANNTDSFIINYTISGKSSGGESFSFVKSQTITKSKTGADGDPGDDGDKNAIAIMYQATSSDSAPAVINDTSTYTFATGVVSNSNGLDSWSNTIPTDASAKYLWTTQANVTASGSASTGSIATSAWSTPVKQAIPQKARSMVRRIYNPSTAASGVTEPTDTTSGTPYNFETGVLTIGSGGTSGWTNTMPHHSVAYWVCIVGIVEQSPLGAQNVTYGTARRRGTRGGGRDISEFSIEMPNDTTKKLKWSWDGGSNHDELTIPDRYNNDEITSGNLAGSGKPWATLPASGANLYTLPSGVPTAMSISGTTLTFTTGGGAVNLSTQDTTYANLAALDSTANTKLSGIASGANNYSLPNGVLTGASISGTTITFTSGGGNVQLTTQDTNTTYSAGDFNIGSIGGSKFNSSGNISGAVTLGSNITFDAANNRILITD